MTNLWEFLRSLIQLFFTGVFLTAGVILVLFVVYTVARVAALGVMRSIASFKQLNLRKAKGD